MASLGWLPFALLPNPGSDTLSSLSSWSLSSSWMTRKCFSRMLSGIYSGSLTKQHWMVMPVLGLTISIMERTVYSCVRARYSLKSSIS